MKTVYVCPGSCKGVATEAQWRAGAKTCGATACELHGKPLQKRKQCEMCGKVFTPEEKHEC
jgi:hypothetical protein